MLWGCYLQTKKQTDGLRLRVKEKLQFNGGWLQISVRSFFSSFYFGDDDGSPFVANPVDDSISTYSNAIEGFE